MSEAERELEVLAEIHVPGLDLFPRRWNHHLILFQEIHDHIDDVRACARTGYASHGRGCVNVSVEDWRKIVKELWLKEDVAFPCSYRYAEDLVNFGLLTEGFQSLLRGYDPDREFVLTVHHHPGDLLSAYLIQPSNGVTEE